MAKTTVRSHLRRGNRVISHWRTIPNRDVVGYQKIDGGYVEYVRDDSGRIIKRVHFTRKGSKSYQERDVKFQ